MSIRHEEFDINGAQNRGLKMKKEILIIDDEVSFNEMVKLNLELTGKYNVKAEFRGSHGLDAAKEFKPDLILLDILMPGLNGIEVLGALKNDDETKAIPVIMLSALKSTMAKNEVIDIHSAGTIEKPFTFNDLESKISEVLERRR